MRHISWQSGFSLVEILVSLFIVSLVAVNIAGVQKIVGDQSRDNYAHLAVIKLVTGKFAQLKQSHNMQDIIDLNGTTSSHSQNNTTFLLTWRVSPVSGVSLASPVRNVEVTISWLNAQGNTQNFTYSELISLMMLLKGAGGEEVEHFLYQVPNLLESNGIGYFDAKMDYEIDAYVIYNSQLLQATSAHFSGDGVNANPINSEGVLSEGWQSHGLINNPALATLFSN